MAPSRSQSPMIGPRPVAQCNGGGQAEHFVIHSQRGPSGRADLPKRSCTNGHERHRSPGNGLGSPQRKARVPTRQTRLASTPGCQSAPSSGSRAASPKRSERVEIDVAYEQATEFPPQIPAEDKYSSEALWRQNEELRLQVQALREEQMYTAELHSQVIATIVRERNELEQRLHDQSLPANKDNKSELICMSKVCQDDEGTVRDEPTEDVSTQEEARLHRQTHGSSTSTAASVASMPSGVEVDASEDGDRGHLACQVQVQQNAKDNHGNEHSFASAPPRAPQAAVNEASIYERRVSPSVSRTSLLTQTNSVNTLGQFTAGGLSYSPVVSPDLARNSLCSGEVGSSVTTTSASTAASPAPPLGSVSSWRPPRSRGVSIVTTVHAPGRASPPPPLPPPMAMAAGWSSPQDGYRSFLPPTRPETTICYPPVYHHEPTAGVRVHPPTRLSEEIGAAQHQVVLSGTMLGCAPAKLLGTSGGVSCGMQLAAPSSGGAGLRVSSPPAGFRGLSVSTTCASTGQFSPMAPLSPAPPTYAASGASSVNYVHRPLSHSASLSGISTRTSSPVRSNQVLQSRFVTNAAVQPRADSACASQQHTHVPLHAKQHMPATISSFEPPASLAHEKAKLKSSSLAPVLKNRRSAVAAASATSRTPDLSKTPTPARCGYQRVSSSSSLICAQPTATAASAALSAGGAGSVSRDALGQPASAERCCNEQAPGVGGAGPPPPPDGTEGDDPVDRMVVPTPTVDAPRRCACCGRTPRNTGEIENGERRAREARRPTIDVVTTDPPSLNGMPVLA